MPFRINSRTGQNEVSQEVNPVRNQHETPRRSTGEAEIQLEAFITSALNKVGCFISRSGRFTLRETDIGTSHSLRGQAGPRAVAPYEA